LCVSVTTLFCPDSKPASTTVLPKDQYQP
jgi:hypothetical protein